MATPQAIGSAYFLKLLQHALKSNPTALTRAPGNLVFQLGTASWTLVTKGAVLGLQSGIIDEEKVCFAMIATEDGLNDYLSGDDERIQRALGAGELGFHGKFEFFSAIFAPAQGKSMLSLRASNF